MRYPSSIDICVFKARCLGRPLSIGIVVQVFPVHTTAAFSCRGFVIGKVEVFEDGPENRFLESTYTRKTIVKMPLALEKLATKKGPNNRHRVQISGVKYLETGSVLSGHQ